MTETPNLLEPADGDALRLAGWNDAAVWEIAALVSFFNFSGRLEAASGLPPDQIPENAKFAEAHAS